MKAKIFMTAVLVALFFSVDASAWCVTEIKRTKECANPTSAYLMTDVEAEEYVVGFCLDLKQVLAVVEFLEVNSLKELVGQCHEEGKDWDRAPLVIKIMDQSILLFFKSTKTEEKKNSI